MKRSDPSLVETVAQAITSSTSSSAEEGRFVAGTLIAGRYRILGLLGRGGMGEVYRATDLTLGQSIALKFLPEEAARDQRLLERFHGEVRVARQVSHPNICRVYDIGQIEGMPFLSMEYVDGEDLASLLLRIGRLPADKAIETARKLCAGLAAAHARGVIHRDLKPPNIMINKRGEVVIMDFGLAAVAAQLTGPESRNGTPAYMSPEQIKGAEVTARSDIYALGLVLYELFTGKRPYQAKNARQLLEMQESAQLTSMSSVATDVDPAVEKVIRRCLDPDPAKRPASALSVAAALPGGDPLAEALAAGEMPSPELVAASGTVEGLDKKYSIPLLVAAIGCLLASIPITEKTAAVMHSPLDIPPVALQQKAREIAGSFGYSGKPADSAYWVDKRRELVEGMAKLPEPRKWDEWLAAESPIDVVVRESPALMIAKPDGVIDANNPPPTRNGMLQISVDGGGRLVAFEAVPLGDNGVAPIAPETVFQAAGFDFAKFSEKSPDDYDHFTNDRLEAWTGPHPVIPGVNVDVEIAWWKGRVTFARALLKFPGGARDSGTGPPPYLTTILGIAEAIGSFFAILLAHRNWKNNRGDRKGALRLAWLVLIASAVDWAAKVHVVPSDDLFGQVFGALGEWLFVAMVVWLLYLALEPALRARWPHSIVSWNRLLAGKWRDAQVGSDVLLGAAIGGVIWVAVSLADLWMAPKNTLDPGMNLWAAEGIRHWLGANAVQLRGAVFVGLVGFITIFGLRRIVRNDIAAALAASVIFTAMQQDIFKQPHLLIVLCIWVGLYGALVFTLLRVGLVATIAAVFFINSYQYITIGTEHVGWTTAPALATLALLIGIAVFAFRCSLASRPLIGEEGMER